MFLPPSANAHFFVPQIVLQTPSCLITSHLFNSSKISLYVKIFTTGTSGNCAFPGPGNALHVPPLQTLSLPHVLS